MALGQLPCEWVHGRLRVPLLYILFCRCHQVSFVFCSCDLKSVIDNEDSRNRMYGALQTSWYFGYTAVACFGLFMMLGTVGHHAAQTFVRKIYANVGVCFGFDWTESCLLIGG